jgi:hypothetical protein
VITDQGDELLDVGVLVVPDLDPIWEIMILAQHAL